MSYLDHIARCNARDLRGFRRFVVGDAAVGWVAPPLIDALAAAASAFTVTADTVRLRAAPDTPSVRSRAIAEAVPALTAAGTFPRPHGELYAVKNRWSDAELMRLDRAIVPCLGVRAYGVHLNGYVRTAAELALWIGTRAMDRAVAPGKFDNMVAGGQPAGLGLRENLVKECAEEAALPAALAARARAAGAISYAFNSSSGLRNDVMFCYDLEMPAEVTPRSADGEVSGFELMPIADVLGLIRDTDRFKLNVNLVILDFAIRHGVLTADNTPDFEAIVTGLRSPLALDSM